MKNKKILLCTLTLVLISLVAALFIIIPSAEQGTLRGDADGNGTVDLNDLVYLRRYFSEYDYDSNMSPFEVGDGADANCDGIVSILDVIALRRYFADGDWTDVFITENEGVASVRTQEGMNYTVTGYKSVENERFVFNKGLEITFDEGFFADEFNRLNFSYEVSEPIKLFITYSLDGEEKTDYFFLEATKTSFRGLIEGYLAGKKGVELQKLTVDTCESVEATFILNGLDSEVIPLYDDDLTVENDRYKVGCRLSWGGAITYFEDKQDGDDTLGNLVNIHDTGRLIQQSFYGTYTNDEGYTSVPNGNEGAALWPYNPVQGGDRKNNGSDRLIDVEYDEEKDYIYIVTQPLDWAYVKGAEYEGDYKGLTYTYYENTYAIMKGESDSLDDDYVLVDNVATDFSGWTHPSGGQEIPAVYILSYFDTFSYYNGFKPWTKDDEGIYYEAELEGWENAGIFPLFAGNSETWSIWINSEDNFGFGTYCPNIQKHIAIRHQYDGTKDPMGNSTSYVAPSCNIVMQAYKPIVYSYILATGTPEEIRDVFTANKDFTDNPSLSEDRYDQLIYPGRYDMMDMDFTVENNEKIFYSPKHLDIGYDAVENALKLYVENGSDPNAELNFDWNSEKVINSDDFNTIEIEYMLPETNSRETATVVLYLCAGDVGSYKEQYTVSGNIIRDGNYHTLSIKVPAAKCSGDMHKIRFDPFATAAVGDIMYIKRISLTKVNYPEIRVDNILTEKGSENVFSSVSVSEREFDENIGAVKLTALANNADVNFTLDMSELNILAEEYVTFVLEYMIPAENSKSKYESTLYFDTLTNKGYSESKAIYSDLTADGEYHTLTLQLNSKELWAGVINKLRFDYFQGSCTEGDVIYIKRIALEALEGFDIPLTGEESEKIFKTPSYTNSSFDHDSDELILEVSGGSDVYIMMDLSEYALSTEGYSRLFIRYKMPTSNSQDDYVSAVYFTTDESASYSESKAVYGDRLVVDGVYHTLIIDLSQKEEWTGSVAKIRLDYFQSACEEGDIIYIKSISLK